MSGIIPKRTIDTVRSFSDLGVHLYGIDCTLYVPTNLTALEAVDMYSKVGNITYRRYVEQKVVIEWYAKDISKLRKLGVFSEEEAPITAKFTMLPEVVLGSYIKLDTRYVPDKYDTDEFEAVNIILSNTYDSEVLRRYKMAPRRVRQS